MPQLMPLNWMFSSFMIMLVIMSSCVIYSMMSEMKKVEMSAYGMKTNLNMWCW